MSTKPTHIYVHPATLQELALPLTAVHRLVTAPAAFAAPYGNFTNPQL